MVYFRPYRRMTFGVVEQPEVLLGLLDLNLCDGLTHRPQSSSLLGLGFRVYGFS